MAGYQPWGWIVGSGVYTNDIEAYVWRDIRTLGLEIGLATLLLLGVIFAVRRSITRPVAAMTQLLEAGVVGQRLDGYDGRTELDRLACAVNRTLDRVSGVVDDVADSAHAVTTHVSALADSAHRIEAIQADSRQSVVAVRQIAQVIGQINEYQMGIAAAVEQQSATMANVNTTVTESSQAGAASGVAVAAVARAADDTRRQLDGVSRAVDALRQVAKDLEETAGVFRR